MKMADLDLESDTPGTGRPKDRAPWLPPLRVVIPLLLIVFCFGFGALALLVTVKVQTRLVESEYREGMELIGILTMGRIESYLRSGNPEYMGRAVRQLSSDRNLRHAFLVDAENRVAETTQFHLEGQPLTNTPVGGQADLLQTARENAGPVSAFSADRKRLFTAISTETLMVMGDLENAPQLVLLMEHDLSRVLGEHRGQLAALTAGGAMPVLGFAFLMGVLIRYTVYSRLVGLSWQIDRVMNGSEPSGRPLRGRDEISRFSRSIESMAAVLQTRTEALRESEKRFSLAMEGANEGLWDWDLTTGEVYYSLQWKRMLGYDDDELENVLETWKSLLHPEDRDRSERLVQEYIDGKRSDFHIEFRLRCRSGGYREILSRAFTVKEDGKLVRLVGTHVDITELKQTKRELRLAQFAIDQAPEEIFWVNRDATFRHVNDTAVQSLGYSRSEFAEMTVADLDVDRQAGDWDTFWNRARDEGSVTLEARHRTAAGEVHPVEIRVSHGNFEGSEYLCAFSRDITERKEAEQRIHELNEHLEDQVRQRTAELESANRELESFAHTVSHDLRAPLRGMSGFSEALVEDYGDSLPEEARDYLDRIQKASRTMGDMIDGLLDLSRVTRGKLSFSEVNLSELVTEIVDRLQANEPERNATVEIAPDLVAQGDRRLLASALSNLVGNSWKFTAGEPETRIEFGRRESGGETVYFVADNGAGFDAGHGDKLFQPFQRFHARSEFDGEGIGLATVKRVVERHGGRVCAESAPGEGATIHFTIGGKA